MRRVPSAWASFVACVLAAAATSSGAQTPRPFLDVQPIGVLAPGTDASTIGLGSGFMWQAPRTVAWLCGSAALGGGSLAVRTVDGELRSVLRQLGPFDLGVDSRAQFDALRDGARYGTLASSLRLGTRSPVYGVRLGAGTLASSVPGASLVSPWGVVGGWIRVLGVSASGELAFGSRPGVSTIDTVVPRITTDTGYWISTDSGMVKIPGGTHTEWVPVKLHQGMRANFNEARFALGARFADVFIDGTGGLLFAEGGATRAHGMLTVTRWVAPQVALMAGAGVRVIDAVTGVTDRSLVFGLRLAPQRVASGIVDAPNAAPTQLAVSRVGDRVTLTLRAPGARQVEIAGDFTEWSPVALSRAHGDTWSVSVPLAPGVYRLNVRVDDGEWTPPPGVSRTVDAYEGTVGVLIVN